MPQNPQDVEVAAGSPDPVTQRFLRRIEKLAVTFLGCRFASAQDLWRFQLDLLDLQRDIQTAVNTYKVRVKRKQAAMEILTDLRACRWHARRLGDAFAWIVLGRNKKVLEPLSRNERNVVLRDGHGSRGMILAASHLANQGWGFPLIHDVTDCLRIGDVTFVQVREGAEPSYRTVEVKTRAQLKRRLENQNLTEYEYKIQLLWAVPFHDEQEGAVTIESAEFESVVAPTELPTGRRIGRQANRMSTVLLHQTAKPNALIEEEGKIPAVWTTVTAPVTAHWKSLQRVVRKARRTGYGSELVDGTFLYVALYSGEGLSPQSKDCSDRLGEDLSNPALLVEEGPNVLSIALIPPAEQNSAHLFLPFFLYPIPRSSVCDIIHGRMIIFVCLNEGRLVEALKNAGFHVEFDATVKRSPLIVSGSVAVENDREYHFQHSDFRYYLDEIIYEFRGRDAIVHAAKTMLDAAVNVVPRLEEGDSGKLFPS